MIYDPEDIEQYAPLWSWEPSLYIHLTGSRLAKREAVSCQVYVPAKVQARSSWVTVEMRECTAPALLAALSDEMAVVKRIPVDGQGIGPWRVYDLVVTESHLSNLTSRSRIVRRYKNLATAITRWPDDPDVRAACISQESRTVMIVSDTEIIAELPRLEDDELFLPTVVDILRQELDARPTLWDKDLPFQSTYYGLSLAFKEGQITPYGSRLRMRIPIGNDERHRPAEPSRWVQREMTAMATTDVRRGPLPETVRLTAIPPGTPTEIQLFNERLALSPVHLLSREILRVQRTLHLLGHWSDVCQDVELWSPETREANLVEDLVLRKQFLCVDAASECFQPTPHLWSKP